MFSTNFITTAIQMLFINLCISYVFMKNTGEQNTNKLKWLFIILNNLVTCIVFAFLQLRLGIISNFFISYIFYSLIIKLITKRDFSDIVFIMSISIALSLIASVISSVLNYISFNQVLYLIKYEATIYGKIFSYITLGLIQFILIYSFFKIRRFRYGFSFLKESSKIKDIGYIGSIIGIVVIIISIVMGSVDSDSVTPYLVITLLVLGIVIYKWIRKQMKINQMIKMTDTSMSSLENQLKEEKDKVSHYKRINHNYSNRIAAMELAIESANELTPDLKKAIKTLAIDFRKDNMPSINIVSLPTTGVSGIDSTFAYMLSEAEKDKIEFNLTLNDSLCISYMVKNTISEGELITIINNHIRNSIIAINKNNKNNKRILCILGLMDDCYGFSVSDTGIEFEINTLLNLGLEEVTTHENQGGSGIGLMTTFEIARKYNSSLIIEENVPSDIGYTKTVEIHFDGKNEYKIRSYRADEIQARSKDNRIIIEKI